MLQLEKLKTAKPETIELRNVGIIKLQILSRTIRAKRLENKYQKGTIQRFVRMLVSIVFNTVINSTRVVFVERGILLISCLNRFRRYCE